MHLILSQYVFCIIFLNYQRRTFSLFALAMVFFEEKQDLANGEKEDLRHFERRPLEAIYNIFQTPIFEIKSLGASHFVPSWQ